MKHIPHYMAIFLGLILLFGCADNSTTSTATTATTDSTTDAGTNTSFELYSSAQAVGPRITPTTVGRLNLRSPQFAVNWQSGGTLYEVYYLIRAYAYPDDEGVLDGSNMWKAMHTASGKLDTALNNCTAMTERAVTSSFDFGVDALGQSYDCGYTATSSSGSNTYYDSIASKKNGNRNQALASWATVETSQTTRSVMETYIDGDTGLLSVNEAYLVSYADGSHYSVRLQISGDKDDGSFSLKLAKAGSGSYKITIAGYGYSQGSGYYLFKVSTGDGTTTTSDRYYCFKSATTQAEIQAMDDAGSASVPADCSAYGASLPTAYSVAGGDNPTGVSAFTGGGPYGMDLGL